MRTAGTTCKHPLFISPARHPDPPRVHRRRAQLRGSQSSNTLQMSIFSTMDPLVSEACPPRVQSLAPRRLQ